MSTSKKPKVFVIANNAANTQAALRKLPHYISLSCFQSHITTGYKWRREELQWAWQYITNAKKITSFFRHSGQNASKLTKLVD